MFPDRLAFNLELHFEERLIGICRVNCVYRVFFIAIWEVCDLLVCLGGMISSYWDVKLVQRGDGDFDDVVW